MSNDIAKLDAVIDKHIPRSKSDQVHLDRYASGARSILEAAADPYSIFEVESDAEALASLGKHLDMALKSMGELSVSTNRYLTIGLGAAGEPPISRREVEITMKQWRSAVKTVSRWRGERKSASKKRNWQAAAIAFECRYIWGQRTLIASGDFPPAFLSNEERAHMAKSLKENPLAKSYSSPATNDEVFEELAAAWEARVWEVAPKTQRYDDPGPFGRFLEEIFWQLQILGSDGSPFRAATALQSLTDLERKE